MRQEERHDRHQQRHPLRPGHRFAQPRETDRGEDRVDNQPRNKSAPHLAGLGEAAHQGRRHRNRYRGRRPAQPEDRRIGHRSHAQHVAQHEGSRRQVGHEQPERQGIDEQETHEDVIAGQLAGAIEQHP